jgi:protein required for attachment to host cells
MTKPLRILFVVADGARARWVRRSVDADAFVTARDIRVHAGAHSGGDHDDHEHAAFARQVADAINGEAQFGPHDRLVLIAPAHILVAIQRDLSVVARRKVFRTLAKDLYNIPDSALGDWLRPLELG